MIDQILVPSLGESITEATVSKWLKNVGEEVNTDEPIVELETDKVNVEVPSPSSGTLSSIEVKEGDTVEVGSILGVINKGKSNLSKSSKTVLKDQNESSNVPSKKNISKKRELKEEEIPFELVDEPFEIIEDNKDEKKEEEKPLELVDDYKNKDDKETLVLDTLLEENINEIEEKKYVPPKRKQNLSPAVRKIVEENQIDISDIVGSGKDGRLAKGDLLNQMGSAPQPSKRKITHGPEERVQMTRLRSTIAKRLKESQDNAAMLTTFNEVDMHSIMQMREDYQDDFVKKYSVKLGFMSFFVKASIVALKNFPAVNAEVEDNHIIYKNYYNVSIAIGTDRGLVVPVIKKADELSFANIEKNISLLSEKAQRGKITINDLQGGTFTISNGGIYGSMLSTPILNPPQTGILGMHNIVDRPVAINGDITIRPIMYLALSYDHRIIDGKEAVSFLKTIKECLEEPRRLFLDL
ncbi:MAG TPA: 2-oxoglutarate dehydrogenase complex dihydrolipoyllysine-residue succinyltransferase [Candidatus Pelagibacter sp.]|jgi:2-oxoglutarate dehydrogenase E2 component (dihydrolipoamide succinyltransferase)|nr:2-oxoglutarate dehydrogenase complex dihydrolipoyllysine-residue succinyltransferase [Candidatus Pelagibacter sp.]